ncbi:MAG TPA: S8 family serine peptidase [Gemmatimonadales bacterium]|nr:S8 family serine peptidase [Gemmatimonadales bacterium]
MTVQDAQGNTVTSSTASVTLAITSGTGTTGAVLGGTLTRAAASGVATFNDLTIDKAGSGYTLTATATSLSGATSNAFSVNVGSPTKLAFVGQPSAVAQGSVMAPAVQVAIQDAGGNTVTNATNTVTLSITSGTGTPGAVLGGTLVQASTAGIASFADLTVDLPGTGYTLTATATTLTSAASSHFTVNGGSITGTITLVSTFLSPPPDALHFAAKQPQPRAPQVSISPAAPYAAVKIPERTTAFATRLRAIESAQPEYVANELVVTYTPAALGVPIPGVRAMSQSSLEPVARAIRQLATPTAIAHSAEVAGVSPVLRAARLRFSDPSRLNAAMLALRSDPSVVAVERNAIAHSLEAPATWAPWAPLPPLPTTLPNDPGYPWQAWHYEAIDLSQAWSLTTGSASVLVAVVDDGIRFDHPAIASNLTRDGYDFASSLIANHCAGGIVDLAGDGGGYDADPTIPVQYVYNSGLNCYSTYTGPGGHGLHVAGTIGAVGNDGVGGTGVNWTVRIRPVRALNSGGSGSTYDIAQAILYAAGLPADNGSGGTVQASSGARIINLSLGGPGTNTFLQNAVTSATAAGALLIAAAGNDGTSTPNYPAAYSEVVSVTAVGPDFLLASYSTYGSTVDLAAPGGDIADGGIDYGVYSTRWNFGTNSATYESINGTSMAAPHVSGVAALLLAQTPSLTTAQLRARLESYAVDLGVAGRDDLYGFGLVNARNSLTQSLAPAQATFARLYNAVTGAIVADVTLAGGATYSFTQVRTGSYWVYGGQDEDADRQIGIPGRRWSAAGGTATPLTVSISGAALQTVNFNLGFGYELEPNNTSGFADVLALGGYLFGYASNTDADYSTVLIPVTGQYTFETRAFRGACGFAEELDTVLWLYDSGGTLIASNDDINFAALNLCSRLSLTLSPGRYYVVVSGYYSSLRRYYVTVRAG